MEQEEQKLNSLPDNAYRELKPGEVYKPIMPANSKPREVTTYSVVFGIIMAIVFSAAAAYLGLKVGQVFEAAIPIAIIAVGCGNLMKKNNMLGQNVIIQSIGASSGVIVAGAIFTLPALYILGLDAKFYQIFLSSLLGGLLGILMLIPFRKYFVKDMHGKYPFPEATATTEVLVSGEKKGNQAKLLAVSGLVGGLYDFFISTFGWWTETISTRIMGWGEMLAEKTKLVFKVNTGAAVLGLGYIVGLKYAAIICAGSFTVWFVLIPFLSYFADGQTVAVGEGVSMLIRDMSPEQFGTVRPGDIKYKDVNGDGVITDDDQVPLFAYSGVPQFMYGFGAEVRYKNWTLNVLFKGTGNNYFLYGGKDGSKFDGYIPFNQGYKGNVLTLAYDPANRWTSAEYSGNKATENPHARFPRLSYGNNANNTKPSTFWKGNARYLRLQELSLNYNLRTPGLRKALGLQSIDFQVMCENLAVWDGVDIFDPEQAMDTGHAYPIPRRFSLQIYLNF